MQYSNSLFKKVDDQELFRRPPLSEISENIGDRNKVDNTSPSSSCSSLLSCSSAPFFSLGVAHCVSVDTTLNEETLDQSALQTLLETTHEHLMERWVGWIV